MIPESLDFEIRRGHHPDVVMNQIEQALAEQAFNLYTGNSIFSELPLRTIYNYLSLNTFYGNQNPEIIKLLQRLEPYPFMLELEATQWVCPLKCIFCEIQYDKREKPMQLSYKDFLYIVNQFPDLRWAGVNALGEPLTNPDFLKMVWELDRRKVAQEIYMTTFLLKEEDMKQFVNMSSFLLTKFSIDGATKETYEKVRVGSNFDKVIRNIKALARYKRQAGRHWPQIEFHYLVLQQNIHECEMFIDLIDSLNIECTGIMFSQLLHEFPGVKNIYTKISSELGNKLVERGKRYGIPVYFNGDAAQQKPPAYTCTQWMMPYIFPSGDVIPCCNGNEACMRTEQREWSMGNVFKTPFRQIWNGPKYRNLRKTLMENNVEGYMPVCKNLCAIHDITAKRCQP